MGVGVVGIIECNFLKPTHNKQDFDYTNEYRYVAHLFTDKLRKGVKRDRWLGYSLLHPFSQRTCLRWVDLCRLALK